MPYVDYFCRFNFYYCYDNNKCDRSYGCAYSSQPSVDQTDNKALMAFGL